MRARVISKLKSLREDPDKTFGALKSRANSVGVGRAIENLSSVISMLEGNPRIQEIGNTNINAWFKGWDAPGDSNIAVFSGTSMTVRKFIANVVSDSELVASLFAPKEPTKLSENAEENKQRTRLGTFLVALENSHPEAEYKTMFRSAHEKLI